MLQNFLALLSQIDWQTVTYVGSSVAVLLAVVVFIWEVRANRQEREFTIFFRFIDTYSRLMDERKAHWKKIKETIQNNPNTKQEIGDRTNSLDYLLLRAKQSEPFYAIEHSIIEYEIRSLSLLNEICYFATKDHKKRILVNIQFAHEISFYQNRLDDLLFLVNRERGERLFSVPRYSALKKYTVKNFSRPAEDYLEARAKRASKTKFRKAISKVAKVEPPDYDRL